MNTVIRIGFMKRIEVPEEEISDVVIDFAKSIASNLIPASAPILDILITTPYEERKASWMRDVTDILNELQARLFDIDRLRKDPEFFDILIQAVHIGIKTHKKEKKLALKNAIINSAFCNPYDFTKKQIFMNFIDIFTDYHVKLLVFMNNSEILLFESSKTGGNIGGVSSIELLIANVYPELIESGLVDVVWTDLFRNNLLKNSKEIIVVKTDPYGVSIQQTTPLGSEFIKFISDDKTTREKHGED